MFKNCPYCAKSIFRNWMLFDFLGYFKVNYKLKLMVLRFLKTLVQKKSLVKINKIDYQLLSYSFHE